MATKKNAAAVQAATEDEAMTTAEVSTQTDEQANEVAEPILLDTTFQQAMNQTNALLAAIAGKNYPIDSWKAVQNIVRLGLAPQVFAIGDLFRVSKGSETLTFEVAGFDSETLVDKTKKHSMQLHLLNVYKQMQCDNTEALYYAKDGLAAGIYHFTLLPDYDTTYGGGSTFQFQLTKPVPAGGILMFPWGWNTQASTVKISSYTKVTDTDAIETVPVSLGAGGTDLGTADGKTENMNHTHRIRYGSNNWSESAIRQWLNSDGAAGTFWVPKTVFDRPPTWNSSMAGWMNGMDADFLEVIAPVRLTTARNNVNEGGGSDVTIDKFYFPARPNLYMGKENNIDEGPAWQRYSAYSDKDAANTGADSARVKRLNGNPQWYWIRTPNTGNANYVRYVYSDGSLDTNNASNGSGGVAPACTIA